MVYFFYLQVLEIGCGNSRLSEELYKDGVTDITCIDISTVAVEKMQNRLLGMGYKGLCFHDFLLESLINICLVHCP